MSLLDSLRIAPRNGGENSGEILPELPQDPAPNERPPARKAAKKAGPAARPTTAPSTARMAKEVAEDLATLLEGGAALWGLSDECCAPVLEQQARPIAVALTGILARNPRLLAKFAGADIVSYTLQVAALGRALAPVGTAFYRNHVSKAHEEDQGEVAGGGINLAQFAPVNGIRRN